MRIFIFGDSITQGLWDKKGGWADRLKAYVQAREVKQGYKKYQEVFNLGIDGNTTLQIIDRFQCETVARLWPGETYGFIFATGTNDSLHRANGSVESTPNDFAAQLQQLHQMAAQFSATIAFVDLLPVNEALTNPVATSSTGKCYTNKRIDQFNEVLYTFGQRNKLSVVKVSKSFKAQDYNALLADGLHPNSAGHELMFKTIAPLVEKWL